MSTDSGPGPAAAAEQFARALRAHVPCLEEATVGTGPAMDRQVAEALGILVELLGKIEATLQSQLELLGKGDPSIKTMAETLGGQGLLNVGQALSRVLKSDKVPPTALRNYSDLVMRWWSAVLTGTQATVMEVPNEVAAALNPADWPVEKRRWSAEADAYWNHFKHVIRHELPLKLGDRMKQIQARKTLDAYRIMGGEPR